MTFVYKILKVEHFFNLDSTFQGTPLEWLQLILNEDFLKILFSSNFLKQMSPSPTFDFFWPFLACWISMGILHLASVRDHFRRDSFYRNRIANLFISLNQFEKILHSLSGDVVDLSEIFQQNLLSFYKPSMSSTIDETMIAFSGKSSIKVFIQGKPHPNGFKFYSFVDASGVLCRFFLHTKTKLTLLQIFERLLDKFPNHSLKIYSDKYFGSYETVLNIFNQEVLSF